MMKQKVLVTCLGGWPSVLSLDAVIVAVRVATMVMRTFVQRGSTGGKIRRIGKRRVWLKIYVATVARCGKFDICRTFTRCRHRFFIVGTTRFS